MHGETVRKKKDAHLFVINYNGSRRMLLSTTFYSESVAVGFNSEHAAQLSWCYFLVPPLALEHIYPANESAETVHCFCHQSVSRYDVFGQNFTRRYIM
jgi:hypothetical protein